MRYEFYAGPMGEKARNWTQPVPMYRHILEVDEDNIDRLVDSRFLNVVERGSHYYPKHYEISNEAIHWMHEQGIVWSWQDFRGSTYTVTRFRLELPMRIYAAKVKLAWG